MFISRVGRLLAIRCAPREPRSSRFPGDPKAYAFREFEQDGNLAGWNVGIEGDPLDLSNNDNLVAQSLYEVSIEDRRFLPIWLLPVNYTVSFDGELRRLSRS